MVEGGTWVGEGIGDVWNIPTQLHRGFLLYFSERFYFLPGFTPARQGTTCLARDQALRTTYHETPRWLMIEFLPLFILILLTLKTSLYRHT